MMIIFDFQNTFKNSQKLNPFFYDLSYGIFFKLFSTHNINDFFWDDDYFFRSISCQLI